MWRVMNCSHGCRSVLLGLACAWVGTVGGTEWIAEDGDWNVAANWSGNVLPSSSVGAIVANGGIARLKDGDVYTIPGICVGFEQPATVIQTGGSLVLSGSNAFNKDGCFGTGCGTNVSEEAVYELQGGSLTLNSYGQVGRYAAGSLDISGGVLTAKKWFSVGRFVGAGGTMLISGGTFVQTAEGTIVGESGVGTLVVTNTGVFSSTFPLRIGETGNDADTGESLVRLAQGGTLSASEICRETGTSSRGVLELDGGRLVVAGNGATVPGFIRKLKGIRVQDGGILFDTQSNIVGVDMSFEGCGTAENFVKLGSGSLTLGGTNTWKGLTIVSNGTLIAASPAALPGWDEAERVRVCLGATISFGDGWTAEQIATARANLVMETGSNRTYNTQEGDIEVTENLALETGIDKLGTGTLTLSGQNTYAGALTVWSGLVRGDFGVGLDVTQNLLLNGGTYVPLTGGEVTNAVGTGPGQIALADDAASGFSAKGGPLRVHLDTGAADGTFTWGNPGSNPGALVLNGAEADDDLVFENPIDLNGRENATISVGKGQATVAGGLRDGVGQGSFAKSGTGTLVLGTGSTNVCAKFSHGDGTTVFANESTNSFGSISQEGGEVRLEGGTVDLSGHYTQNAGDFRLTSGALRMSRGTYTQGCAIEGSHLLQVDGGFFHANSLQLGSYPGSRLAIKLNGGEMALGTLQLAQGVRSDASSCSFTQNGGVLRSDNSSATSWEIGRSSGYTARYVLNDGQADADRNFVIGYGEGSTGFCVQNGGEFVCRRDLSLGRGSRSIGYVEVNGGTLTQSEVGHVFKVGESGQGRLDITDGGAVNVMGTLNIGVEASGQGSVMVHPGGTLNVARVKGGAGSHKSLTLLPGATLAVAETGGGGAFLEGLDRFQVSSGATIDTQGRDVTFNLPAGQDTSLAGKVKYLTHRWSFNGTLSDDVGGADAVMDGGAAYSGDRSQVVLPGGSRGVGAINLGANLLPSTGDVTIELWATQVGIQSWSRILDIGSSNSDALLLAWTAYVDINKDDFCMKSDDGKDYYDHLAPYTLGTEFHIALTFSHRTDGKWDVKIYKQDAVTGKTLTKLELTTTTGWSPATQNQSSFYLGRSHASADPDARANYNEVRIWNTALSEEELETSALLGADASFGGGFTKTGAGKLAFTGAVDGYAFDVREGSLALGMDPLVHRWSFNGDLSDSAGGQTATMDGNAAFTADGQVRLPGGKGAGAVSLGADVLPASGDVTIELWATQQGVQSWSRILGVGSDPSTEMLLAWTAGTNIDTDDFCIKKSNNAKDWRDQLAPYTLGTEFHIALTFCQRTDGLWDVKVYKQDAVTGMTSNKLEFTTSEGWRPATQAQTKFYLGRSLNTNDSDAQADYNEMRIWNTALTETQLTALAVAGPDVIPSIVGSGAVVGTENATVKLATGSTLDLVYGTCALKELEGSGTVRNGTLAAEAIRPGGTGAVGTLAVGTGTKLSGTVYLDAVADGVCDCLAYAGALDATGLSLALEEDAVLSGSEPYVIATFAPDAFTGPFASVSIPNNWRLRVNASAGEVRLARAGFAIYFR